MLRPLPPEETLTQNKGCLGCQLRALAGHLQRLCHSHRARPWVSLVIRPAGAEQGQAEVRVHEGDMGGAGQGSGGLSPLHTSSPSSSGLHARHKPAPRLTTPALPAGAARPPPAQSSLLPVSTTSFYLGDWNQTLLTSHS